MAVDYSKLKVVDLKAELKNRGLPQNGLKAELVARLDAADAEAAGAADAEVEAEAEAAAAVEDTKSITPEEPAEGADKDLATQDVSDDVKPSEDTPGAVGPDESVQDQLPDPTPPQEAPATIAADAQGQSTHSPQPPDVAPAVPVEDARDSQKRKRRSGSPQPSAEDVARKRAKQDDQEDAAAVVEPAPSAQGPEVEMEDVSEEPTTNGQDDRDSSSEKLAAKALEEDTIAKPAAGVQNETALETVSLPTPQEPSATNEAGQQPSASPRAKIERDIDPAIHPATSALYIKNFMRPLRPQAVQDHLLDLATPPGMSIDDSTIVDFYLDTIRTHSFVVFSSVSAASRVRMALHDRIWPDETNRKPLWVDFVPPERFREWVDVEQASSGSRGSANRYEIVYEYGDDGYVVAKLQEAGAAPPATKQPPSQPSQPERQASIPTGPSRPFLGVEGAPLGPRGFQQGGRGVQVHPSRLERLSEQPLTTRAYPSISYKPVSEELAERRLSVLSDAKTRDFDRDFGKDYKRYYFEDGDYLVDRGPEIFLGIRPPHRERQRRQGLAGGRRAGDGGGGGGGGRGRGPRRGPPLYHGVPRGGDRFRPQDSSGPGYGDRSRHGGERYRSNTYDRY